MSTFSGLNTAYTALVAARRGLDVAGQNIANSNTDGYTRQRISTSASNAVQSGMFSGGARPGQGVVVDGIARLGDVHLDARVRATAAGAGFSAIRAQALSSLELSLNEPGENGISASLQNFWAGWQSLSNQPGEGPPAAVLLEEARKLSSQVAEGYRAADAEWSRLRGSAQSMVAEVNSAAAQIAEINGRIRSVTGAGGSANELIDRRSALATTIAALAGGTVREQGDGTMDVLIGGNAIVSGDTARALQISGPNRVGNGAVSVEWQHREGIPAALESGEIAGALTVLAPANDGAGGALAKAARFYNDFAQSLATSVNNLHRQGVTTDGDTGRDFFAYDAGEPALSLAVLPQDAGGIAAAEPGLGGRNGSIADSISQLGTSAESPDSSWASFVTEIGRATRSGLQGATLAGLSASSAAQLQLSNASVSMDEEQMNLLTYQHAYQGAARVMTAVDEMLDVLINRTGIVGR